MRRVVAVLIVLLGVFAACSDDTSVSSSATSISSTAATLVSDTTTAVPASTVDTTVTPTTATAAPTTAAPVTPAPWREVEAPAECVCADGSPYSYWIRNADPTKVVFFLQGGGACFDASTCAFDSGAYKTTVVPGDDPSAHATGIFDFTDSRNPLAGYSFVFAPYCTGDLHIGNSTHEYGPQLTVQHKGSIDATTALGDLAAQFPNATDVVVAGESAGSAPTPLYAGLAHDLLPNAAITVLADGSGAYPDVPAVNAVIGATWGTESAIPPWPENAGLTAATWSLPGLFVQAHKHDPEIIFGRHDYAYDRFQQLFAGLAGFAADDLLTLIDQNETQIEQGGVDLRSYISPGSSHTVLGRPEFYTETVEGVPLVEWVTHLVRRAPDPDVHCVECR